MKREYRLMLFDLVVGGHHGFYIQHLVEHWDQQNFQGGLDIVVAPAFLEKHADIVQSAAEQSSDIQFVAISPSEDAALKPSTSGRDRLLRSLQEWRLMCRYAKQLKVSQVLLMYFDTAWLPVALGLRAPCPFSGIYFRPALHYKAFANSVKSHDARFSQKENLSSQQQREKFALTRWLKHPQLRTLFTLDTFSVKPIAQHITQVGSRTKIKHLPDPIALYQPSPEAATALKVKLGADPNRKVFLLFGALTHRKGIDPLLAAIRLLPADLCQRLCLVLLGEGNNAQLEPKVNATRQAQPVQIVEQYQFVPDLAVRDYFEMADVVLAPVSKACGHEWNFTVGGGREKAYFKFRLWADGRAGAAVGFGVDGGFCCAGGESHRD